MRSLLVFIGGVIASSVVFASGITVGNGGYVVQCSGEELVTLDYYEAGLPTTSGKPNLLSFADQDLEETKQIIDRRLARLPVFHQTVLSRFQEITRTENWILADLLPQPDDTNIIYTSCEKPVRAAFRQSGIVYLQKGFELRLSKGQIFILGLHEWLYETSKSSTSEKTRHTIRELIRVESEFSQSRFLSSIEELLSSWTPLTFDTDLRVSSLDKNRLDQECRSRGAEFATFSEGYSYTKPNCGGDCTTNYVRRLTCAKLFRSFSY